MTKIKPLRIGTNWRDEIEYALRFMAIGFVLFLLWEVVRGSV